MARGLGHSARANPSRGVATVPLDEPAIVVVGERGGLLSNTEAGIQHRDQGRQVRSIAVGLCR